MFTILIANGDWVITGLNLIMKDQVEGKYGMAESD
jgi:hypothetical protein